MYSYKQWIWAVRAFFPSLYPTDFKIRLYNCFPLILRVVHLVEDGTFFPHKDAVSPVLNKRAFFFSFKKMVAFSSFQAAQIDCALLQGN